MKVETYKCEVCGVLKQTVNHWFVGQRKGGAVSHRLIEIEDWSDTAAEQDGAVHLCGQAHAMEWFGKQLSK